MKQASSPQFCKQPRHRFFFFARGTGGPTSCEKLTNPPHLTLVPFFRPELVSPQLRFCPPKFKIKHSLTSILTTFGFKKYVRKHFFFSDAIWVSVEISPQVPPIQHCDHPWCAWQGLMGIENWSPHQKFREKNPETNIFLNTAKESILSGAKLHLIMQRLLAWFFCQFDPSNKYFYKNMKFVRIWKRIIFSKTTILFPWTLSLYTSSLW